MGQILTSEQIPKTLAAARGQGSLVFTNGCFDLLHVGHLRYLQQARSFGAALIVAVNTDASVQRLKGPSRPILPEDERAELLAGLACVDYVVLFDEPTPERLLRLAKPDIYVKGGQYNLGTLPETPVLQELGTDVRFVPMIEGRSTSWIIEKIQSLQA